MIWENRLFIETMKKMGALVKWAKRLDEPIPKDGVIPIRVRSQCEKTEEK